MSDTDKPFVCTVQGCGQRFANHDHLSTHQQKHEFSLRFRPGDTLLVDQTPTPTRFLRNCEESGLFQELEDNPFDQDFSKSKTTVTVSSGESDGKHGGSSLANTTSTATSSNSTSSETGGPSVVLTNLPAAAPAIPVAPPANLVNPDKPIAMATAPAHISTASALTKQRLLQTIQMKEQQKLLEQTLAQQLGQSPEMLAQALKSVIPVSEGPSNIGQLMSSDGATFITPTEIPARRKRGRKPDDEDPEIKRQRFLERNRAAASRCRAKKKLWVDSLEGKYKEAEMANQNLVQEVAMLRSEVQQLKSILIAHKDCPLIVHQSQTLGNSSEQNDSEGRGSSGGGMTLLSQLAAMPSMSPLIASPVPSVGSVVPNMHNTTSIVITNGLTQQQTPEVVKDVEISAEAAQPTEQ